MSQKSLCKALARSTGKPCMAKALANGRCRNHGGLSTGAKTIEGKQRLAEALETRLTKGQLEKAIAGYQAWLNNGGREILKLKALARANKQRR